jgi:hypothetical protein
LNGSGLTQVIQKSKSGLRRTSVQEDPKNGKRSTEIKEIKSILSKRYVEFLEMVKMYQKNAGLKTEQEFNGIIPVSDFKSCLKAFGIFLS